mmetsp:Transcript_10617/g.14218  ORF Transcript_10617/g.14218 Transcript_10617/m.14218 type:complete len:204 (+) Transcript_10617:60-671(+)|eukprot:CAMPEP_0201479836 /NCGR_PEP_ID=MMETSP0151_2-20130828/4474_1 /ASSEMBLY_ACC=CAM_ASM_000257 /TAXON_ID=200890 /ORGANISM="Paramoeba atlantica, Strain 621/1 / CCAP 1560/9" /LENGTH=203 /DNA_ID=CAMNT_0047861517 /DNA_START=28 /DNA_END=639 /DNA_ORIENTATION=+
MLSLHTADAESESTRLGKVKAALPQEYGLALFIKDIENPHPTWNATTPLCEWYGVTCDEEKNPTEFEYVGWHALNEPLRGELSWAHLPDTIINLRFPGNELSGGIAVKDLPRAMTEVTLSSNKFTGELDLEGLPDTMECFEVDDNDLEGFTNMDKLPTNLSELNLGKNVKLQGVSRSSLLPVVDGNPCEVCLVDTQIECVKDN